ncbi:MAG: UDP-N-acetylmuramoyl-tripeptide--D-alanyl-D-alanine ligase [Holosporales bacterium]|jgi:UDP-N-acetylmuramoyl-tripeptide--D-alanyl-D-alanine ligase|nr:UDP-N-acetylmuramoyl-tripeptide--D-alanyl-D-alanine ligase [Holosporales bacterium]
MPSLEPGENNMNNEQQAAVDATVSEKNVGWTFDDIVHALRFFSVPTNIPITGFSIDSRDLVPGEAFVALKGARFDGHDFLAEAYERGAVIAIVDRQDLPSLEGRSYLRVPDTGVALLDLAQYARGRTSATVVGISGSVGKTTVRTWIAELLSKVGLTVSSKKNFNGKVGLPLSMTALTPQSGFGVFEIGIDSPGAMQPLATLCRPHVALLTPIVQAHVENFNSMDLLAHEKALLCSGLCPDGIVIVDHASSNSFPGIAHLAKEYGAIDVVTVGSEADATVRIVETKVESNAHKGKPPRTHVTLESNGVRFEYSIALVGRHAVLNSVFAFAGAVGAAFEGTWTDIVLKHASDIRDIFIPCMERLQFLAGRGQISQCRLDQSREIIIVDDAYNANLASMLSGLDSFESIAAPRKVAVVGDMLGLGAFSEQAHSQLFDAISASSVDSVFCTGTCCASAFSKLPSSKRGGVADSIPELERMLRASLLDGDAVWFKGSHSVGIHELVGSFLRDDQMKSREAA